MIYDRFSLEDQRRRIENINRAHAANRKFLRRERIRDYLPGQVTYWLGDYPARVDAAPTEYDEKVISEMAAAGIRLLQVHEDWNDAIRLWGGDKYHAPNSQGMKDFVALCHAHGIKVIAYISSGYFQATDPDFREDFLRRRVGVPVLQPNNFYCRGNYFDYRKCSHGSHEWRAYILPRSIRAMDEYGFDGIYNDWGYDGTAYARNDEPLPYDPDLEDLIGILYNEVKSRGGVYKLHADRNNRPPCIDKIYDYLWIGEGVDKSGGVGIGKDYPNYVIPCLDRLRVSGTPLSEERYFARTVPFLQFPLLKYGRPLKANNLDLPGVTYYGEGEQMFFSRVRDYLKEHPDGKVYSYWSSIPDDPDEYPNHLKTLGLYLPMVAENSVAYIEVRESAEILSPIPEKVYFSTFVNEETYAVVSNFEDAPYELVLADKWKNRVSGVVSNRHVVPAGEMLWLVRVGDAEG